MKAFRFLIVAIGAMFGIVGCTNNDCNHDFIEHDYTKELIGTWTIIGLNYAEALEIKSDGTMQSTIVSEGEIYESTNRYEVVNNRMKIWGEGFNIEGRLDLVAGVAFSLVIDEEQGYAMFYEYCAEELSDDIIGMWVCNDGPTDKEDDMTIQVFGQDGSSTITGFLPDKNDYVLNSELSYKVVGNLIFFTETEGDSVQWKASLLNYTPNGTTLGDIMSFSHYYSSLDKIVTTSWLRIKQNLDFSHNAKYNYSNIYVTNVKGNNEEMEFAGQIVNFSTLNGDVMDKMLKNILFNVSFHKTGKIVYNCFYDGEDKSIDAPIVIEGNKVTIKMSENNPVYRDLVVYAFQDVDGCQLHMYMPTSSFENFVANVSVVTMAKKGNLDLNDSAAVAAVYDKIHNAIESINVSFIFRAATRAL